MARAAVRRYDGIEETRAQSAVRHGPTPYLPRYVPVIDEPIGAAGESMPTRETVKVEPASPPPQVDYAPFAIKYAPFAMKYELPDP